MTTKPEYYGHKTMVDGSRIPLTKDEAEALIRSVEDADARRAQQMPTARDALAMLISSEQRLKDLGWWKGGGLRVKRGDECAVAETGSTGIWHGRVDVEGTYVHYCDCVASPRERWLKPLSELTDEERAHMLACDLREAEAHKAEMDRWSRIAELEARALTVNENG